jgi:hypothetical protein
MHIQVYFHTGFAVTKYGQLLTVLIPDKNKKPLHIILNKPFDKTKHRNYSIFTSS